MDVTQITDELSHLSWQEFAILGFAVALVDWIGAVLAAVSPPINYFSFQQAAKILETHVLKRVFPIAGTAFIAQSVPAGALHDGVWLGACGLLALYVFETVKSLVGSVRIAQQISDEVHASPMTATPVTVVNNATGEATSAVAVETASGTSVVPDPASIMADEAVPDDVDEPPYA